MKMSSLFSAEINRLKHNEEYLEKQEYCAITSGKYGAEAEEFLTKFDTRTCKDPKVTQALQHVMRTLNEKKQLLKSEDIHTLDVKIFKQTMVHVQEEMNNLKINIKLSLADLKFEEKEICEELQVYNQRIAEWEKPINIDDKFINYKVTSNVVSSSKLDGDNNKDVEEFSRFIYKSKGHENGWSTEDHSLFLKLRSKYKNIDDLSRYLHKLLPDISIDEIKSHEAWYRKYVQLHRKQREALKKWKENTQERQQTDLEVEEIRKENTTSTFKNTDIETRQKLAKWKLDKEERRKQNELIQKIRSEQSRKMSEKQRKLKEEVKKSVEKWKATKLIIESHEKYIKQMHEDTEKKQRAMEANRMIKQFRSHDDLYLLKFKSRHKTKEKEVIRSKSSKTAERDPQRLLKPTKQWIERTSKNINNLEAVSSRTICHVLNIPKLHVPEWKKNNTLT